MKITIVGIGYVGLSLATLLSQDNDVYLFDIDGSRVDMVNKHHSGLLKNIAFSPLKKKPAISG